MGEVDGEEEEHAIGEKSGDAENRQDNAEDLCKRLHFLAENIAGRGHGRGGIPLPKTNKHVWTEPAGEPRLLGRVNE